MPVAWRQQLHVVQVTADAYGSLQPPQLKQLFSPPNERGGPGIGRLPPTTREGSVSTRIVLRDSFNAVRFFILIDQ